MSQPLAALWLLCTLPRGCKAKKQRCQRAKVVKMLTQNAVFVRLMPNEEDPYILINLLTTHLQIFYIFGYKGSWRTYYAPTSFFVKKVTEYNRERRCDCKGFVKSHERIFPIIITLSSDPFSAVQKCLLQTPLEKIRIFPMYSAKLLRCTFLCGCTYI